MPAERLNTGNATPAQLLALREAALAYKRAHPDGTEEGFLVSLNRRDETLAGLFEVPTVRRER